jgi:tetratricopeptide (TPR) repeat protein
LRTRLWLLPLLLLATIVVYLPGLNGPFLFDDTVHITRNKQVQITDLSLQSLAQAWDSSFASGLGSRPLAQLSFGINHALSGLDAWYFKATNLGIHLAVGLLIFALVRQLGRALSGNKQTDTVWPALLVTALWLLHPINLTPVLYVVQRMTGLSTLFVVAGLWCHVTGRLQMAKGASSGFWLALAGLPIAAIGGLAKESAALYPLLVLVLEWTLLRKLTAPRRGLLIAIAGVLPIAFGTAYLLTHLGLLGYQGRDFTLEQRLLTEARVLWLYLRMLVLPDPTLLGFYHDDIATSLNLTTPWTTLPAVLGWLVAIPLAIVLAKRWPVASFGLLFFLAGHAMESTIFPLELVFEHRNYLPSLGPVFAVGWWLATQSQPRVQRGLALMSVLLLVTLAAITHLRALDWSNHDQLLFSEVRHHPESPRANFRVAQLLIDQVGRGRHSDKIYRAAQSHLQKVRELDPENLDALFGLVFLDLFADKDPPQPLIGTLVRQLRTGVVDPTKLAISQFSFLVRWQAGPGHKLPHEQALRILQAAAANPRMNGTGRAGVLSATRAYYDLVLHDLPAALPYAQQAVHAWPGRWHYQYRLVQLLIRMGRWQQARAAFEKALKLPSAELNLKQRNELADVLERHTAKATEHHD